MSNKSVYENSNQGDNELIPNLPISDTKVDDFYIEKLIQKRKVLSRLSWDKQVDYFMKYCYSRCEDNPTDYMINYAKELTVLVESGVEVNAYMFDAIPVYSIKGYELLL